MYGAIIGDIAGSKYEFLGYKKVPQTILDKDCFFTDDTVMTVAVADALINKKDMGATLREYGRKYPAKGYGLSFDAWLKSDDPLAYFSYGNGAAMRVSAAAWIGKTWGEVMDLATKATIVTHNHPEGLRGAQAVATAIYMARKGFCKTEIMDYIENEFKYDVTFTLDEIRPVYMFDESCQETVPAALVAFYESTSFDTAIKLAISLGGDADTLAAIVGSIAEAYYGVPDKFIRKARKFIPKEFRKVVDKIY